MSGKTYTMAVATNGSNFDITVSATVGNNLITQTIENVSGAATGSTKEVSFAALGLTLTLNDNFDDGADAAVILADAATASVFQVGAKNTDNDRIGVLLGDATTTALLLSKDQLLAAEDAQTFMATVDTAIDTLNTVRGDIGAAQNRLTYAAANLSTVIENVQAAESVIRDVDMAAEMTTFTKNQILLQAGTAMLAQANMAPQSILSLLG